MEKIRSQAFFYLFLLFLMVFYCRINPTKAINPMPNISTTFCASDNEYEVIHETYDLRAFPEIPHIT